MESITNKITSIVSKAKKLHETHLSIPAYADYVCIFAQNNAEFDFYAEEALKLGTLVMEQDNSILVQTTNPLDTSLGTVQLLKVRKPDNERPQEGYVDLVIEDYENFKEAITSKEFFSNHAVDVGEMWELKDLQHDVLIYYPSIPLGQELNDKKTKQAAQADQSELQLQLEEERGKRLQLMADFQNYKKRMESERATFGAIANMGLIQELLEVSDDINLALQDGDLDLTRAKESLQIAKDKLAGTAKNAGIEKIEIAVGGSFDKNLMEAIQAIPNPSMKDKVVAVISSAYKYVGSENVIRHAKVIVGK